MKAKSGKKVWSSYDMVGGEIDVIAKTYEQERAAFEAWAQDSFELHHHSAGEYSSSFTQTAWAAWQARAVEGTKVKISFSNL